MNQIEIEFKNLLTKEEFGQLCTLFHVQPTDFFTQENHYFDTPSFALKNKQAALRVRQKQDGFELTLKQPASIGLLETTQSLRLEEAETMLAGKPLAEGIVKKAIKAMSIDPLEIVYFGSLKTHRAELQYSGGLIVLDHSQYLNTEDYEIEYEVDDFESGQALFYELLSQQNIPIRETENKIKRFYNHKNKV